MRDADGIFLGNHVCKNYRGLSSYYKRVCCGGREVKATKIVCAVKGIVESDYMCHARCDSVEK